MNVPRSHYEAQIKRFDPQLGSDFEDALATLAFRHKLAWFNDDQIAEIRDLMLTRAADSRRRAAASRKAYAERRAADGRA